MASPFPGLTVIPPVDSLYAMENTALIKLLLQVAVERNQLAFKLKDTATQFLINQVLTGMQAADLGWADIDKTKLHVKPVHSERPETTTVVVETGDVRLIHPSVQVSCFPGQAAPRILSAHAHLSRAGAANPLLLYGLNLAFERAHRENLPFSSQDEQAKQMGISLAHAHKSGTKWFDRKPLEQFFPPLADESRNSSLYPIIAECHLMGIKPNVHPAKVKELMESVPRYHCDASAKLVTVHGFYTEDSLLRSQNGGPSQLVDFRYTCVSSAVQDLIHAPNMPFLETMAETYYFNMNGFAPRPEELKELLFDALIAEHVHYYILRGVFIDGRLSVDQAIQHAKGFTILTSEARSNPNFRDIIFKDGGPRVCRDKGAPEEKAWAFWTGVRGYRANR